MPKLSAFLTWRKVVALLMAGLFLLETAAWAAPAPIADVVREAHLASREIQTESLVDKIQIPSSLGSIQEVFQSSVVSRQSLVHIEDAHGEPEAQKNTQAILEYLQKHHGIQTFFLEGAWSKLDASRLKFSTDSATNRTILKKLTEKGIVGGPELFLADHAKKSREAHLVKRARNERRFTLHASPVAGYGIEDLELYKKNLAEFRAVMEAKPESDKFLNEMKAQLLTKASQVLNPELADYFRSWSFHEEIEQDYSAHLRILSGAAKKHLKLDLNDAREQYDWPQLIRFFKLKEFENIVQSEAYLVKRKKETQKLEAWLLSKGASRLTLHKNFRESFENFYARVSPLGFRFKDYPELSREWGKQILMQELDAPQLLKEIEKLEHKLLEKLAQTPDEKKLIAKYREYLLLRKLLRLELTKEEWKQFRTTDHRLLTTDLARGSILSASSQMRTDPSFGGDAKQRGLTPMISKVVEQARAFYQTAEKRDEEMFNRTLGWIKKEKISKAAIITGGFHSEGMAKLFKEKNISYLRVQPRITQIKGRENYLKLMTARSNLRAVPLVEPGLESIPDMAVFYRSEIHKILADAPDVTGTTQGVVPGSKARSEMRNLAHSKTPRLLKPMRFLMFGLLSLSLLSINAQEQPEHENTASLQANTAAVLNPTFHHLYRQLSVIVSKNELAQIQPGDLILLQGNDRGYNKAKIYQVIQSDGEKVNLALLDEQGKVRSGSPVEVNDKDGLVYHSRWLSQASVKKISERDLDVKALEDLLIQIERQGKNPSSFAEENTAPNLREVIDRAQKGNMIGAKWLLGVEMMELKGLINNETEIMELKASLQSVHHHIAACVLPEVWGEPYKQKWWDKLVEWRHEHSTFLLLVFFGTLPVIFFVKKLVSQSSSRSEMRGNRLATKDERPKTQAITLSGGESDIVESGGNDAVNVWRGDAFYVAGVQLAQRFRWLGELVAWLRSQYPFSGEDAVFYDFPTRAQRELWKIQLLPQWMHQSYFNFLALLEYISNPPRIISQILQTNQFVAQWKTVKKILMQTWQQKQFSKNLAKFSQYFLFGLIPTWKKIISIFTNSQYFIVLKSITVLGGFVPWFRDYFAVHNALFLGKGFGSSGFGLQSSVVGVRSEMRQPDTLTIKLTVWDSKLNKKLQQTAKKGRSRFIKKINHVWSYKNATGIEFNEYEIKWNAAAVAQWNAAHLRKDQQVDNSRGALLNALGLNVYAVRIRLKKGTDHNRESMEAFASTFLELQNNSHLALKASTGPWRDEDDNENIFSRPVKTAPPVRKSEFNKTQKKLINGAQSAAQKPSLFQQGQMTRDTAPKSLFKAVAIEAERKRKENLIYGMPVMLPLSPQEETIVEINAVLEKNQNAVIALPQMRGLESLYVNLGYLIFAEKMKQATILLVPNPGQSQQPFEYFDKQMQRIPGLKAMPRVMSVFDWPKTSKVDLAAAVIADDGHILELPQAAASVLNAEKIIFLTVSKAETQLAEKIDTQRLKRNPKWMTTLHASTVSKRAGNVRLFATPSYLERNRDFSEIFRKLALGVLSRSETRERGLSFPSRPLRRGRIRPLAEPQAAGTVPNDFRRKTAVSGGAMRLHLEMQARQYQSEEIFKKYPKLLEIVLAWDEFQWRYPRYAEKFNAASTGGAFAQSHFDWLEEIAEQHQIKPGKRLLDGGSGNGLAALGFHILTGVEVWSIEIDTGRHMVLQKFLEFLSKEKKIKYPKVHFEEADFLKYPLKNFDLIYFYFATPKNRGNSFGDQIAAYLRSELAPGSIFISPGFYLERELLAGTLQPVDRAAVFHEMGLRYQGIPLKGMAGQVAVKLSLKQPKDRSEMRSDRQGTRDSRPEVEKLARYKSQSAEHKLNDADAFYAAGVQLRQLRQLLSQLLSLLLLHPFNVADVSSGSPTKTPQSPWRKSLDRRLKLQSWVSLLWLAGCLTIPMRILARKERKNQTVAIRKISQKIQMRTWRRTGFWINPAAPSQYSLFGLIPTWQKINRLLTNSQHFIDLKSIKLEGLVPWRLPIAVGLHAATHQSHIPEVGLVRARSESRHFSAPIPEKAIVAKREDGLKIIDIRVIDNVELRSEILADSSAESEAETLAESSAVTRGEPKKRTQTWHAASFWQDELTRTGRVTLFAYDTSNRLIGIVAGYDNDTTFEIFYFVTKQKGPKHDGLFMLDTLFSKLQKEGVVNVSWTTTSEAQLFYEKYLYGFTDSAGEMVAGRIGNRVIKSATNDGNRFTIQLFPRSEARHLILPRDIPGINSAPGVRLVEHINRRSKRNQPEMTPAARRKKSHAESEWKGFGKRRRSETRIDEAPEIQQTKRSFKDWIMKRAFTEPLNRPIAEAISETRENLEKFQERNDDAGIYIAGALQLTLAAYLFRQAIFKGKKDGEIAEMLLPILLDAREKFARITHDTAALHHLKYLSLPPTNGRHNEFGIPLDLPAVETLVRQYRETISTVNDLPTESAYLESSNQSADARGDKGADRSEMREPGEIKPWEILKNTKRDRILRNAIAKIDWLTRDYETATRDLKPKEKQRFEDALMAGLIHYVRKYVLKNGLKFEGQVYWKHSVGYKLFEELRWNRFITDEGDSPEYEEYVRALVLSPSLNSDLAKLIPVRNEKILQNAGELIKDGLKEILPKYLDGNYANENVFEYSVFSRKFIGYRFKLAFFKLDRFLLFISLESIFKRLLIVGAVVGAYLFLDYSTSPEFTHAVREFARVSILSKPIDLIEVVLAGLMIWLVIQFRTKLTKNTFDRKLREVYGEVYYRCIFDSTRREIQQNRERFENNFKLIQNRIRKWEESTGRNGRSWRRAVGMLRSFLLNSGNGHQRFVYISEIGAAAANLDGWSDPDVILLAMISQIQDDNPAFLSVLSQRVSNGSAPKQIIQRNIEIFNTYLEEDSSIFEALIDSQAATHVEQQFKRKETYRQRIGITDRAQWRPFALKFADRLIGISDPHIRRKTVMAHLVRLQVYFDWLLRKIKANQSFHERIRVARLAHRIETLNVLFEKIEAAPGVMPGEIMADFEHRLSKLADRIVEHYPEISGRSELRSLATNYSKTQPKRPVSRSEKRIDQPLSDSFASSTRTGVYRFIDEGEALVARAKKGEAAMIPEALQILATDHNEPLYPFAIMALRSFPDQKKIGRLVKEAVRKKSRNFFPGNYFRMAKYIATHDKKRYARYQKLTRIPILIELFPQYLIYLRNLKDGGDRDAESIILRLQKSFQALLKESTGQDKKYGTEANAARNGFVIQGSQRADVLTAVLKRQFVLAKDLMSVTGLERSAIQRALTGYVNQHGHLHRGVYDIFVHFLLKENPSILQHLEQVLHEQYPQLVIGKVVEWLLKENPSGKDAQDESPFLISVVEALSKQENGLRFSSLAKPVLLSILKKQPVKSKSKLRQRLDWAYANEVNHDITNHGVLNQISRLLMAEPFSDEPVRIVLASNNHRYPDLRAGHFVYRQATESNTQIIAEPVAEKRDAAASYFREDQNVKIVRGKTDELIAHALAYYETHKELPTVDFLASAMKLTGPTLFELYIPLAIDGLKKRKILRKAITWQEAKNEILTRPVFMMIENPESSVKGIDAFRQIFEKEKSMQIQKMEFYQTQAGLRIYVEHIDFFGQRGSMIYEFPGVDLPAQAQKINLLDLLEQAGHAIPVIVNQGKIELKGRSYSITKYLQSINRSSNEVRFEYFSGKSGAQPYVEVTEAYGVGRALGILSLDQSANPVDPLTQKPKKSASAKPVEFADFVQDQRPVRELAVTTKGMILFGKTSFDANDLLRHYELTTGDVKMFLYRGQAGKSYEIGMITFSPVQNREITLLRFSVNSQGQPQKILGLKKSNRYLLKQIAGLMDAWVSLTTSQNDNALDEPILGRPLKISAKDSFSLNNVRYELEPLLASNVRLPRTGIRAAVFDESGKNPRIEIEISGVPVQTIHIGEKGWPLVYGDTDVRRRQLSVMAILRRQKDAAAGSLFKTNLNTDPETNYSGRPPSNLPRKPVVRIRPIRPRAVTKLKAAPVKVKPKPQTTIIKAVPVITTPVNPRRQITEAEKQITAGISPAVQDWLMTAQLSLAEYADFAHNGDSRFIDEMRKVLLARILRGSLPEEKNLEAHEKGFDRAVDNYKAKGVDLSAAETKKIEEVKNLFKHLRLKTKAFQSTPARSEMRENKLSTKDRRPKTEAIPLSGGESDIVESDVMQGGFVAKLLTGIQDFYSGQLAARIKVYRNSFSHMFGSDGRIFELDVERIDSKIIGNFHIFLKRLKFKMKQNGGNDAVNVWRGDAFYVAGAQLSQRFQWLGELVAWLRSQYPFSVLLFPETRSKRNKTSSKQAKLAQLAVPKNNWQRSLLLVHQLPITLLHPLLRAQEIPFAQNSKDWSFDSFLHSQKTNSIFNNSQYLIDFKTILKWMIFHAGAVGFGSLIPAFSLQPLVFSLKSKSARSEMRQLKQFSEFAGELARQSIIQYSEMQEHFGKNLAGRDPAEIGQIVSQRLLRELQYENLVRNIESPKTLAGVLTTALRKDEKLGGMDRVALLELVVALIAPVFFNPLESEIFLKRVGLELYQFLNAAHFFNSFMGSNTDPKKFRENMLSHLATFPHPEIENVHFEDYNVLYLKRHSSVVQWDRFILSLDESVKFLRKVLGPWGVYRLHTHGRYANGFELNHKVLVRYIPFLGVQVRSPFDSQWSDFKKWANNKGFLNKGGVGSEYFSFHRGERERGLLKVEFAPMTAARLLKDIELSYKPTKIYKVWLKEKQNKRSEMRGSASLTMKRREALALLGRVATAGLAVLGSSCASVAVSKLSYKQRQEAQALKKFKKILKIYPNAKIFLARITGYGGERGDPWSSRNRGIANDLISTGGQGIPLKTVAVYSEAIPYHSKIYIPGLRDLEGNEVDLDEADAEDTGTALIDAEAADGRIPVIDLYDPHHKHWKWIKNKRGKLEGWDQMGEVYVIVVPPEGKELNFSSYRENPLHLASRSEMRQMRNLKIIDTDRFKARLTFKRFLAGVWSFIRVAMEGIFEESFDYAAPEKPELRQLKTHAGDKALTDLIVDPVILKIESAWKDLAGNFSEEAIQKWAETNQLYGVLVYPSKKLRQLAVPKNYFKRLKWISKQLYPLYEKTGAYSPAENRAQRSKLLNQIEFRRMVLAIENMIQHSLAEDPARGLFAVLKTPEAFYGLVMDSGAGLNVSEVIRGVRGSNTYWGQGFSRSLYVDEPGTEIWLFSNTQILRSDRKQNDLYTRTNLNPPKGTLWLFKIKTMAKQPAVPGNVPIKGIDLNRANGAAIRSEMRKDSALTDTRESSRRSLVVSRQSIRKPAHYSRALNLIAALLLVVPISVLIAVIAIIVKIIRPDEPIFFNAKRYGFLGRPFKMFKFHSINNDGTIPPFFKYLRDTGLDELPQIWNIVKGEMAFRGPRPMSVISDGWSEESARAFLSKVMAVSMPGIFDLGHALTAFGLSVEDSRLSKQDEVVRMTIAYYQYETKQGEMFRFKIFLLILFRIINRLLGGLFDWPIQKWVDRLSIQVRRELFRNDSAHQDTDLPQPLNSGNISEKRVRSEMHGLAEILGGPNEKTVPDELIKQSVPDQVSVRITTRSESREQITILLVVYDTVLIDKLKRLEKRPGKNLSPLIKRIRFRPDFSNENQNTFEVEWDAGTAKAQETNDRDDLFNALGIKKYDFKFIKAKNQAGENGSTHRAVKSEYFSFYAQLYESDHFQIRSMSFSTTLSASRGVLVTQKKSGRAAFAEYLKVGVEKITDDLLFVLTEQQAELVRQYYRIDRDRPAGENDNEFFKEFQKSSWAFQPVDSEYNKKLSNHLGAINRLLQSGKDGRERFMDALKTTPENFKRLWAMLTMREEIKVKQLYGIGVNHVDNEIIDSFRSNYWPQTKDRLLASLASPSGTHQASSAANNGVKKRATVPYSRYQRRAMLNSKKLGVRSEMREPFEGWAGYFTERIEKVASINAEQLRVFKTNLESKDVLETRINRAISMINAWQGGSEFDYGRQKFGNQIVKNTMGDRAHAALEDIKNQLSQILVLRNKQTDSLEKPFENISPDTLSKYFKDNFLIRHVFKDVQVTRLRPDSLKLVFKLRRRYGFEELQILLEKPLHGAAGPLRVTIGSDIPKNVPEKIYKIQKTPAVVEESLRLMLLWLREQGFEQVKLYLSNLNSEPLRRRFFNPDNRPLLNLSDYAAVDLEERRETVLEAAEQVEQNWQQGLRVFKSHPHFDGFIRELFRSKFGENRNRRGALVAETGPTSVGKTTSRLPVDKKIESDWFLIDEEERIRRENESKSGLKEEWTFWDEKKIMLLLEHVRNFFDQKKDYRTKIIIRNAWHRNGRSDVPEPLPGDGADLTMNDSEKMYHIKSEKDHLYHYWDEEIVIRYNDTVGVDSKYAGLYELNYRNKNPGSKLFDLIVRYEDDLRTILMKYIIRKVLKPFFKECALKEKRIAAEEDFTDEVFQAVLDQHVKGRIELPDHIKEKIEAAIARYLAGFWGSYHDYRENSRKARLYADIVIDLRYTLPDELVGGLNRLLRNVQMIGSDTIVPLNERIAIDRRQQAQAFAEKILAVLSSPFSESSRGGAPREGTAFGRLRLLRGSILRGITHRRKDVPESRLLSAMTISGAESAHTAELSKNWFNSYLNGGDSTVYTPEEIYENLNWESQRNWLLATLLMPDMLSFLKKKAGENLPFKKLCDLFWEDLKKEYASPKKIIMDDKEFDMLFLEKPEYWGTAAGTAALQPAKYERMILRTGKHAFGFEQDVLEKYFVRLVEAILSIGEPVPLRADVPVLARSETRNVNQKQPASSEMRIEDFEANYSYYKGPARKIIDVKNKTEIVVIPNFFGHIASIKVRGHEFLHPKRGTWLMWPWAGGQKVQDKKIITSLGEVIDLSNAPIKVSANKKTANHGFARQLIEWQEMPLSTGAENFYQIELNTSSIEGIPEKFKNIILKRSIRIKSSGQIEIGIYQSKPMFDGEHFTWLTPNRDEWEIGIPSDEVYSDLESAKTEKVNQSTDLNQPRPLPNGFNKIYANLKAGDSGFAVLSAKGPRGQVIEIAVKTNEYNHSIAWAPNIKGERNALGLEVTKAGPSPFSDSNPKGKPAVQKAIYLTLTPPVRSEMRAGEPGYEEYQRKIIQLITSVFVREKRKESYEAQLKDLLGEVLRNLAPLNTGEFYSYEEFLAAPVLGGYLPLSRLKMYLNEYPHLKDQFKLISKKPAVKVVPAAPRQEIKKPVPLPVKTLPAVVPITKPFSRKIALKWNLPEFLRQAGVTRAVFEETMQAKQGAFKKDQARAYLTARFLNETEQPHSAELLQKIENEFSFILEHKWAVQLILDAVKELSALPRPAANSEISLPPDETTITVEVLQSGDESTEIELLPAATQSENGAAAAEIETVDIKPTRPGFTETEEKFLEDFLKRGPNLLTILHTSLRLPDRYEKIADELRTMSVEARQIFKRHPGVWLKKEEVAKLLKKTDRALTPQGNQMSRRHNFSPPKAEMLGSPMTELDHDYLRSFMDPKADTLLRNMNMADHYSLEHRMAYALTAQKMIQNIDRILARVHLGDIDDIDSLREKRDEVETAIQEVLQISASSAPAHLPQKSAAPVIQAGEVNWEQLPLEEALIKLGQLQVAADSVWNNLRPVQIIQERISALHDRERTDALAKLQQIQTSKEESIGRLHKKKANLLLLELNALKRELDGLVFHAAGDKKSAEDLNDFLANHLIEYKEKLAWFEGERYQSLRKPHEDSLRKAQEIRRSEFRDHVAQMAERIYEIKFVETMSRFEFRRFYNDYFGVANKRSGIQELKLPPHGLVVLSPDLVQKGFLNDPRILGQQAFAIYEPRSSKRAILEAKIQKNGFKRQGFVFGTRSEFREQLKLFFKTKPVHSWVMVGTGDTPETYALLEQIGRLWTLTDERIAAMLHYLGLDALIIQIFGSLQVLSAA